MRDLSRRWPLFPLVLLLATSASAQLTNPTRQEVLVEDFVTCSATTDQTVGVQAAFDLAASSGKKIVRFRSGCQPFVGPPGTTNPAVSIPSGVTMLCDDPSAGLQAGYKACSGGTFAGSACTTDDTNTTTGCPGATCPGCCVAVGGGPFAPSAGSTYTMVKAATSSADVRVIGCGFNARQIDGTKRCTVASVGKKCSADADCTGGGGLCNSYAGAPAGAGKINVLDLSPAERARVREVQLVDLRTSAVAVAVGQSGRVRELTNTVFSLSALLLGSTPRAVETAVNLAGAGGSLRDADLEGSVAVVQSGVAGYGSNHNRVLDSTLASTTTTTTGVSLRGCQHYVRGNSLVSMNPAVQGEPTATGGACNVTLSGNRRYFGTGPAVIADGAGWRLVDNYFAWEATAGPVVQLGDDGTYSNGGCAHCEIKDSLLYTQATSLSYIKYANVQKRCVLAGSGRYRQVCTTNDTNTTTGCPGYCSNNPATLCTADATCSPGTCLGLNTNCAFWGCCAGGHVDNSIAGVSFLTGGTSNVAVDLSAITSATDVTRNVVQADHFTGVAVGVKMPSSYVSSISKFTVMGSDFSGVTDPLVNWDWRYGLLVGNAGTAADEDSPALVYLAADGSLTQGDAVEVGSAANRVKQATAGSAVAVGVVLNAPGAAGDLAVVAQSGVATCNITDVTLSRGDRLRVSGSTAGKFEAATSTQHARAIALDAYTAGGSSKVRCLLGSFPSATSAAGPVVWADSDTAACSFGATNNTIYTLREFAPSGLTGGKTASIRVTVQLSDPQTGSDDAIFKLYRQTSACPTECTGTTPTGTGAAVLAPSAGYKNTPGANLFQSMTLEWVDTSTASNVRYCLTGEKPANSRAQSLDYSRAVVVEYQ